MDASVSCGPIFSFVPLTVPEVFAHVYWTQCRSRFLSGELVLVIEILIGRENDAMFVFIYPLTSILAEKLSSKLRFFEIEFDNQ